MNPMRYARVLLAGATALAGLAVVSVTTSAPVAAAPGDGTVKVRVVQDFNANGAWDDPFVEPGMGGVEVVATDAAGASRTLTTAADGTVELVGAPGAYRIEVRNPDPATYQPAFASEKSGTADTPSATRFSSNEEIVTVAADQTVTVTTAFWVPKDYCQSNPLIVNACQPPIFDRNGQLLTTQTDTLFTAPYRAYGNDRGKTRLAARNDTGTVYGIGYRKQDKRVFAAAFAKRGTAYGPGGAGAIYVTSATGGATAVWGTVPDVGTTEHSLVVAGGRQDWDFAPVVGKESLGDLDVSEDGDDLQVINLNNRRLYVYDATAATMGAPTHVVDLSANPGCSNAGDWRPGALGERNGVLYVGGVCSAETTQNPADMRAIVLTFDGTTYAPLGTVMDDNLNVKRWTRYLNCFPRDNAGGLSGVSIRPWSNAGITCNAKSGQLTDPSAWMSDIVVENNGDLVVAFRDRTGDQHLGINSPYFAGTDGTGAQIGVVNWYTVAGDVSKACPGPGGAFVLDVNGGCGIQAPAANRLSGEFFSGDDGIHGETAFGGIALSRAERGLVTSAMDPAGSITTQGYFRMDRATGRGIYSPDGGASPTSPETLLAAGGNTGGNRISSADNFGKGQGMADMEVLCDLAPIQIGNRVWFDTDGDGVQGADEGSIAGVTVNLYDKDGALVATTVTNSRGEYYFDSITDGIEVGTDYVIRLDNPADYEAGGPLDADVYELTEADADVGTDATDSDGVLVRGFPEHPITTGDHGSVDHTYDFGFFDPPPAVSVGDFVWVDTDGDGVQDDGEPGIRGVVLVLTGPDGQPVTDIYGKPVGPVTTDADGHYSFDFLPALPPGESYTVAIDRDADSTRAALAPYVPTTPGAGDDRGADSSTWSATSGDLTQDGDRDPTLDFGFVPAEVSVGDLVWVDTDGDGVQDDGEPGIQGVVLVLTGPDGNPVTDVHGNPVGPVTTDADGHYSFDELPLLPPGQSYTVSIDRDADSTKAALAPYVPTTTGAGDPATDSSTWTAESGDLTTDGDRDATLDFGFVPKRDEPLPPPTVVTQAVADVTAVVRPNGTIAPVALTDRVTVTGISPGGTGVATLYGPAERRSADLCTPARRVGQVTFPVTNGTRTTPPIQVREPGYYTWVVTVTDERGGRATHACGLASETTLVHRPAYGPVAIETGRDARPPSRVARPTTLRIPGAGVGATVRPTGVVRGAMRIPTGDRQAGRLTRSAGIGEAIGTTIIAAHVSDDRDDPMAFWNLRKARPGMVVTLRHEGRTYRYRVTGLRQFARSKGIAPGIFRTTGAPRLVLVTCTDRVSRPGGGFHYRRNLVVIAEPITP